MVRFLFITIFLFNDLPLRAQEWWDLKYHEGSDAAKYNNDPGFQSNLNRDTKLRNREKLEADRKLGPPLTKEGKKLKQKLSEEQLAAFAEFDSVLNARGGKLIDCDRCQGLGKVSCAVCAGAGESQCASCHGDSQLTCRTCSGSGVFGDVTCSKCNGTGKKDCQFCHGVPPKCSQCAGLGYDNCKYCRGTAKMMITADAGDTLRLERSQVLSVPDGKKSSKKSKKED
jgi:hypothetical protein